MASFVSEYMYIKKLRRIKKGAKIKSIKVIGRHESSYIGMDSSNEYSKSLLPFLLALIFTFLFLLS